ncbi:uncharacterized protein Z519_00025 [Cladophialophora bantiana CBS 173.52]|uniref:Uncharacterized protein n=1 Tax=Cladophialophora bantiana (strain ATCC 10958 / CBS 173.52 / CDC B-1940 / NIH 8579) TaxID=1442370 RepID=A0A0D2I510_CLAB1|nr:uncharacterized protein Z519_00025 [Cladophialophora bantiana CBS 173.52]KIW98365.1 hypothetical protein Z519_00025 [Cladophialophora bantiana CBS 173.52]
MPASLFWTSAATLPTSSKLLQVNVGSGAVVVDGPRVGGKENVSNNPEAEMSFQGKKEVEQNVILQLLTQHVLNNSEERLPENYQICLWLRKCDAFLVIAAGSVQAEQDNYYSYAAPDPELTISAAGVEQGMHIPVANRGLTCASHRSETRSLTIWWYESTSGSWRHPSPSKWLAAEARKGATRRFNGLVKAVDRPEETKAACKDAVEAIFNAGAVLLDLRHVGASSGEPGSAGGGGGGQLRYCA